MSGKAELVRSRLPRMSETNKGERIDWLSRDGSERFEAKMSGQCEPMMDIASIQCEQGLSHVLLQQ